MSAAYVVTYEGEPEDPDAFVERYVSHHVPIIRSWPGLRDVEILRPADAEDPFPTEPGGLFMIARFSFDSVEALRAALRSDGRRRAREDFALLPPFQGRVRHQAFEVHPA